MAQKMVNGVLVDLTPAEEARRTAEDAQFEAGQSSPRPALPTPEEVYEALLDKALGRPGADAKIAAIDAKYAGRKK